MLDLRTEKNLDALQVDDQISTGQHPDVWATCHRLVDAARRWWTDIAAVVYRSRTTPKSSLNYAFFGDDGFDVESWPLGEQTDVLTALVLHEGFTVHCSPRGRDEAWPPADRPPALCRQGGRWLTPHLVEGSS